MKEHINAIKQDIAYVKQHKTLYTILSAMVMVLSVGFMFLAVFTVLVKIIPAGSWINIVSGHSMDPTLHDGQFTFSDEKEIERGDIVVTYLPDAAVKSAPENENKTLIKRVIGMPGDTIDIQKDGTVLINYSELDESYLTAEHKAATYIEGKNYHIVLRATEYFVMGDNRDDSYDSRSFGPINKGNILYVQSTSVTSLFLVKTVYVILFLILIAFCYLLIDFIVMELAYKFLTKKG